VFERGAGMRCSDLNSVLTGWANFEVGQGNFDLARSLLQQVRQTEKDGCLERIKDTEKMAV
jgi:hypothetical protein